VKRWLPIALVLGVVVAGLVSIFFPGLIAWGTPAPLVLPGIVEIQEVRLASKVGGRIERILVREGERVQPGQKAIVFEAPELLNEKEQLKAKLEAAEAEYLRAQTGPRPEEKEAARAAAEAAKARYERLMAGWRDE
jgi:HlyD family secretion protein